MTDDELDLLASAYLDGEATPEEVALVERDPALQARVAELRAVDLGGGTSPAAPLALKEAHLGAAIQAFEQEMATRRASEAAVAAASGDGSSTAEHRLGDNRLGPPRRWWQTVPAWLPAAAVFVIVGGGFLLATQGDRDRTEETALATSESEDSASDADAAGSAAAELAESDDIATFEMSDEAASDDGSDTAADSAVAESVRSGLADSDDAESDSEMLDNEESGVDQSLDETTAAPLILLDEVPTSLEELELPELLDPSLSPCLDTFADDAILEGWVDAVLDQELVQLWVIQRGPDTDPEPIVVRLQIGEEPAPACSIIEP